MRGAEKAESKIQNDVTTGTGHCVIRLGILDICPPVCGSLARDQRIPVSKYALREAFTFLFIKRISIECMKSLRSLFRTIA